MKRAASFASETFDLLDLDLNINVDDSLQCMLPSRGLGLSTCDPAWELDMSEASIFKRDSIPLSPMPCSDFSQKIDEISPIFSPFFDSSVAEVLSSPMPHVLIPEEASAAKTGGLGPRGDQGPSAGTPERVPPPPPPVETALETTPDSTGTAGGAVTPTLRFTSPIEKTWYAERPFPAFTVEVQGDVHPDTSLCVALVDGHGNDASDRLSPAARDLVYPVVNGTAVINAIRFCGVSSKAGGAFQIVIKTVDRSAVPIVSPRLQVLSYRLYHAPKVCQEKLRPNDSVSKMKGIGSQYAKRLADLGIRRIDELACIDIDELGPNGCNQLMSRLRRDRGALTLQRFVTYVKQARTICDRFGSADSDHTHTVARVDRHIKRRRLSLQDCSILCATPAVVTNQICGAY